MIIYSPPAHCRDQNHASWSSRARGCPWGPATHPTRSLQLTNVARGTLRHFMSATAADPIDFDRYPARIRRRAAGSRPGEPECEGMSPGSRKPEKSEKPENFGIFPNFGIPIVLTGMQLDICYTFRNVLETFYHAGGHGKHISCPGDFLSHVLTPRRPEPTWLAPADLDRTANPLPAQIFTQK